MARDDGFPIADINTWLFDDPKVKALARRLSDPILTAALVALYQATVLTSWRHGERVTLEESAPAWWLADLTSATEHLQAVGLLDVEARIPATSWATWFEPARARREARRLSGAKGGHSKARASAKRRSGDATATLYPSVPTVPSVPGETPLPPASGGLVVNPRIAGTNPRAIAEAVQERLSDTSRARAWRRQQRQMAAYRGAITEEQRMEMDQLDQPLSAIPGWDEHLGKLRDESRPTVETIR